MLVLLVAAYTGAMVFFFQARKDNAWVDFEQLGSEPGSDHG